MGVIMNRVANQFADGGTFTHPSADYLPFYYVLLYDFKKKNTHYEECYRDGW